jgi:hypothetical protein
MPARRVTLIGGCTIAVALLAGCHASASIGGSSISKTTVEQKAATELAAKAHQPTPTVVCPHDLDAKVGATMTCTLTPQGSTEHDSVVVKVTSTDSDGGYNLAFQVEAG